MTWFPDRWTRNLQGTLWGGEHAPWKDGGEELKECWCEVVADKRKKNMSAGRVVIKTMATTRQVHPPMVPTNQQQQAGVEEGNGMAGAMQIQGWILGYQCYKQNTKKGIILTAGTWTCCRSHEFPFHW